MSLELNKISKSYKGKQVLRDISLTVAEGSCTGILGSNGSGKSTLLSVLAGVQKRDSGEFHYQETNLFQEGAEKLIGYVPQGDPLLPELSALDNLKLWYTKENLKRELDTGVLAMLGIPEFLKLPVRKMSGGMKKRLSIGCSVAGSPKILLLDEPSSALDLVCKERITVYLKDFCSQGGMVLLATHDVQELSICNDWYIIKEGSLHHYNYDGDVHRLVGCL